MTFGDRVRITSGSMKDSLGIVQHQSLTFIGCYVVRVNSKCYIIGEKALVAA